MLKLLKHDFHQSGRFFMWLLVIGAGAGLLGALITLGQDPGPGQFLSATLFNAAIAIGAIVMQFVGIILLLVNTNRSLFSERGYLTFSLPVSSTALLGSKLISNVVLMLLNIFMLQGLIMVVGSNLVRILTAAADNLLDEAAPDVLEAFVEFPGLAEFFPFIAFFLVTALAVLILAMMAVLFVITLSHVRRFQRHSGLWTFLFLIAIAIACWAAVSYITPLLPGIIIYLNFGGRVGGGVSIPFNVTNTFVFLALTAVLFFVTDYLLKRKISLK